MHKIDVNQQLADEHEAQQAFIKLVLTAPSKPEEDTLVNYEEPSLIAVQDRAGNFRPVLNLSKPEETVGVGVRKVVSIYRELRGLEAECSLATHNEKEVNRILERAFPPFIWRDGDKIYKRVISSKPATHAELLRTQERLDTLIQEHNLKPTGLCEKRRKYFDELFDELCRQEVIRCLPRGLLLLRIRDELRISLQAYESLYLSNAAYGVRRAIKFEMEAFKLLDELNQVNDERKELSEKIQQVRAQIEEQDEKFKFNTTHNKKLFAEEREGLRRHNHNLKSQLEAIISGSSRPAEPE